MNQATHIKKWNYGEYASFNYGAHCVAMQIGSLDLYFSYDTVVAFSDGHGFRISKNYWGPTTGKHLNWINPNKKMRLDSKIFDQELDQLLKKHKLAV